MKKFLLIAFAVMLVIVVFFLIFASDRIVFNYDTLPYSARIVHPNLNSTVSEYKNTHEVPEVYLEQYDRWSVLAFYEFRHNGVLMRLSGVCLTPETVSNNLSFADLLSSQDYVVSSNYRNLKIQMQIGNNLNGVSWVELPLQGLNFDNCATIVSPSASGVDFGVQVETRLLQYSYNFDFSAIFSPLGVGFETLSKIRPSIDGDNVLDILSGVFVEYPAWLWEHVQLIFNTVGVNF